MIKSSNLHLSQSSWFHAARIRHLFVDHTVWGFHLLQLCSHVRFGVLHMYPLSVQSVMIMMADSMQMRMLGRLTVSSCMLVDGCRVRFLMCRPYCTSDRRKFGRRMIVIGMLLTFFAFCIFQLHARLPWTYNWFFSLMSANCLSLRFPAAPITDGRFPPVRTVFTAGLFNAYMQGVSSAGLCNILII